MNLKLAAYYCLFFSTNGTLRGVRRVEEQNGLQIKCQDPPPDGLMQGDPIGYAICSLN